MIVVLIDRQIEGKVVEISRLQEFFAEKVIEQVRQEIRVLKINGVFG